MNGESYDKETLQLRPLIISTKAGNALNGVNPKVESAHMDIFVQSGDLNLLSRRLNPVTPHTIKKYGNETNGRYDEGGLNVSMVSNQAYYRRQYGTSHNSHNDQR